MCTGLDDNKCTHFVVGVGDLLWEYSAETSRAVIPGFSCKKSFPVSLYIPFVLIWIPHPDQHLLTTEEVYGWYH